jgi:hypothetical protein
LEILDCSEESLKNNFVPEYERSTLKVDDAPKHDKSPVQQSIRTLDF